jgi:VanZ family protein
VLSNGPMNITPVKRVALLFILIVLFIMFFIGGPDYYAPRSYKSLWNLGHIIFFFLLPLLLINLKKTPRNYLFQCALVLTITVLIGVAIEFFQNDFNRLSDIDDLYRNMLGAMAFLLFLEPLRVAISRKMMIIMQSATVTLIVLQMVPIVVAFTDEFVANKQFPKLSSFETPFEIQRWSGDANYKIDETIKKTGKASLRVSLNTSRYSGIGLKYFPKNWENFKYYQAEIFNPSTKYILITFRIHDKRHTEGLQRYEDRFNKVFKVLPGWNKIIVNLEDVKNAPKDRQMEMNDIRNVSFFATSLPYKRTLYVDDVKLLR